MFCGVILCFGKKTCTLQVMHVLKDELFTRSWFSVRARLLSRLSSRYSLSLKVHSWLSYGFLITCLPSSCSFNKALLTKSCRDGCPFRSFSHLWRGLLLGLCWSDRWVPGHLPVQQPISFQFRWLVSPSSQWGHWEQSSLETQNRRRHCVPFMAWYLSLNAEWIVHKCLTF